jgi:hypothetical protein
MSNNLCVHIYGEKSFFKSKTAIKRFKDDLKCQNNFNDKLNLEKYFINGVNYKLEKNDNNIKVNIFSENITNNYTKDTKRNDLKSKLKIMRNKRRGNLNLLKTMNNNNNNIPNDVLQSFTDLNKTFDVEVPLPTDIMKNPENYKSLIQAYASRYNLTKDNKMNKLLNKYFTSLANMLGIEYSKDKKFNNDYMKNLIKQMEKENVLTSQEINELEKLDDNKNLESIINNKEEDIEKDETEDDDEREEEEETEEDEETSVVEEEKSVVEEEETEEEVETDEVVEETPVVEEETEEEVETDEVVEETPVVEEETEEEETEEENEEEETEDYKEEEVVEETPVLEDETEEEEETKEDDKEEVVEETEEEKSVVKEIPVFVEETPVLEKEKSVVEEDDKTEEEIVEEKMVISKNGVYYINKKHAYLLKKSSKEFYKYVKWCRILDNIDNKKKYPFISHFLNERKRHGYSITDFSDIKVI